MRGFSGLGRDDYRVWLGAGPAKHRLKVQCPAEDLVVLPNPILVEGKTG
jgi:hypothetical protein